MPNLTLRARANEMDRLRTLLPKIADITATSFSVANPNVMLIEMSASAGTARFYVEMLYLEGVGRSADELRAFAAALAKVTDCDGGRLAFRGFPVRKGEIVSMDLTMGEAL